MIRLLLVDDQALIRAAVLSIVENADGVEVVGQAVDGAEAVREAKRLRPDVVLMDIQMPQMDGTQATLTICSDPELAAVRVLVLTTFENDENVGAVLKAGASGFIGKSTEPSQLVDAIRIVHAGESLLSPSATSALIRRYLRTREPRHRPFPELDALTQREREVLLLVARGRSNEEIADKLSISPVTAKTHVNRTMTKLGVHDRAQLVIIGYETGLLTPGTRIVD